jgi:D-alanyl-D-alanine carboxypeptidase
MTKQRLFLWVFLALVFFQNGRAQTFPCGLDSILNHTLDSMRTVLNVKSLSAALQFPNNEVWAGSSGISAQAPLEYVTPVHTYAIGSITKTITAACILQLADEGVLSLNDSLHEWLPSFPFVNPNITIRQLLRHQSGLFDVITSQNYNTLTNLDSIWSLEETVTDLIEAPLFQPGAGWSYSNTNYILLGLIIEAATGIPYYEAYRTRFFIPLQLHSMALPPYDPDPEEIAHLWLDLDGDGALDDAHDFYSNWTSFRTSAGPAGGYYATPSDVARWMKSFMRGDLHSASMMTQAKTTVNAGLPAGGKYGLGLMERKFLGVTAYGHGGDIGYSSTAYYFPAKDISIAVLNNDSKVNSWSLAPVVLELFRAYNNCQATTGTNQIVDVQCIEVKAQPNPFVDQLQLSMHLPEGASEVQVVLSNMLGEAVAQTNVERLGGGEQSVQMESLEGLAAGAYFASIWVNGDNIKTIKIFKQA